MPVIMPEPSSVEHLRGLAAPALARRSLPFGMPAIDGRLFDGGLRAGALHEVVASSCGLVDDAAATLFLAGIAAREAHATGALVLWVSCRNDLYAPGLAQGGLGAAQVIYAQPRDDKTLMAVVARDGVAIGVLDLDAKRCAGTGAQVGTGGGRAVALGADISEPNQVAEAFTQLRSAFGAVTILVNNAAITGCAPFPETRLEDWERIHKVNLTGTFIVTQLVLPDMLGAQ